MALLHWNSTLEFGIPRIDRQHARIVQMLNDIHDALMRGHAMDEMERTLDELVRYSLGHFATEEELFASLGYAETEAHRAEHQAFVDRVSAFREAFAAGDRSVSVQVVRFLSEWLRTHIQGTDRKYVELFRKRGIQ